MRRLSFFKKKEKNKEVEPTGFEPATALTFGKTNDSPGCSPRLSYGPASYSIIAWIKKKRIKRKEQNRSQEVQSVLKSIGRRKKLLGL